MNFIINGVLSCLGVGESKVDREDFNKVFEEENKRIQQEKIKIAAESAIKETTNSGQQP